MNDVEVETLIVGAGISGLTAAATLGKSHRSLLIERDAEIGGYCKTVKKDGFTWDYSGHFFHFKHQHIEAWLLERMAGQNIRRVEKKSFIHYGDRRIDFPFQKNIHQLPQDEFIECLHALYFAQTSPDKSEPKNFKAMLYGRFGKAIAEKFLVPYNEKLYATDLSTLDVNAMGRFFPQANLSDIIDNMRRQDNRSYNSTFTYPEGGAFEYVRAIASEVDPDTIRLNESLLKLDIEGRVATTTKGTYRYQQLISSIPFPALLRAMGEPVDEALFSYNQVLVFNLGFDRKGEDTAHWVYFPQRDVPFYRVGYYDNIFETPRMSLYVELGFQAGAKIDLAQCKQQVMDGLRKVGVVTDQRLVAEHAVVMSPAYVHVTEASMRKVAGVRERLKAKGVHSIGRYGGWTYCSIEDNMVEARGVVQGW